MPQPLWTPTPARVADANMTRFLEHIRADVPEVVDFASLYAWSVEHPELFWPAVKDFFGVLVSEEATAVGEHLDKMPEGEPPGARWFPGMRLNFAENLLRFRDDRPALVAWNEKGPAKQLTYAELHDAVAHCARGLRDAGVEAGDRVAGFLPNVPETIIAMLATTSLGAVWSSCSPDFGKRGVLDRFGQIEPKVLFATDGYVFGGKTYPVLERVETVVRELPSVEKLVVVPNLADEPERIPDGAAVWNEFLAESQAGDDAPDIDFEQLPFDHPVYIMYSSGTTGLPKCMVHGAGGTLLQHLKELALHTDLRRADRIFYFTTCGWMMWNWLVSSLAVGSTVLLYDGSPMAPTPAHLWDFAEKEDMTVFGTSAKYLALLEKEGVRPRESHDLTQLRAILSTGSPLTPESFDFVFRDIKEDVHLASISGGTDLISCFALGNPIAPVYRGELQTRGLGMKVEIFDEEGRPVVGKPGELVCTRPFPSMPVAFWNDPGGRRYHEAYFADFPGVWRHGDWAELTESGGLIIYGRSDATLNPGGVRIGTAEIYAQVETLDEVVESIVVGQQWEDDTRIVLFVRLRDGLTLDDDLRDRIRMLIRQNASPFHVPKKILQVTDIPRTRSGKITEIAVRKIIHGQEVKNAEALANPEALEQYRDLEALES